MMNFTVQQWLKIRSRSIMVEESKTSLTAVEKNPEVPIHLNEGANY